MKTASIGFITWYASGLEPQVPAHVLIDAAREVQ